MILTTTFSERQSGSRVLKSSSYEASASAVALDAVPAADGARLISSLKLRVAVNPLSPGTHPAAMARAQTSDANSTFIFEFFRFFVEEACMIASAFLRVNARLRIARFCVGGLAPCGDGDAVEVRLKLRRRDVNWGKYELYAEVNFKDGPKEVVLDKIPYGLMFLKGRNAYIIRPRMEYSRDWYFGIPCNECRGAVLRRIDVLTGEMSTVACLKCDKPICE